MPTKDYRRIEIEGWAEHRDYVYSSGTSLLWTHTPTAWGKKNNVPSFREMSLIISEVDLYTKVFVCACVCLRACVCVCVCVCVCAYTIQFLVYRIRANSLRFQAAFCFVDK